MKRILTAAASAVLSAVLIISSGCDSSKAGYNDIEYKDIYENVSRVVLKNGLTLIIKEDESLPLLSFKVFVKAGMIHEGFKSGSGISYLTKKSLLLGTRQNPSRQSLSFEIESLGANFDNNSHTHDYSSFSFSASAEHYDRGFELYSQILFDSIIPVAEFVNEKEILVNELKLREDEPGYIFDSFFKRSYFIEHPYKIPVGGYNDIFKDLSREDVLRFYKTHYVPNNMVIVVAGPIEREKVLASVKGHFGNKERSLESSVYIPREAKHSKRREFTDYSDKVDIPKIRMAFQTVNLFDEDVHALSVLAEILSGKSGSPLSAQLLQPNGPALDISAESWMPLNSKGAFVIDAYLEDGAAADKTEEIVFSLLEDIKNSGVKGKDVENAKSKIVSSFVMKNGNIENLIRELGVNELNANDYSYSMKYIEGVKGVSYEDVIGAAERYLIPERLTLSVLKPTSAIKQRKNKTAHLTKSSPVNLMSFNLENGINVIHRRRRGAATAISVMMGGGLLFENEVNNGIFKVLANTMSKSTKRYSSEMIYDIVQSKGGKIEAAAGHDSFHIGMKVLNNDFQDGLDLISSILLEPSFDPEDIEYVKSKSILDIKKQMQDIRKYSLYKFNSYLWKGHSYRLNPLGSINAIEAIEREDLVEQYKKFVVSSNITITVVGDIDSDVLKESIRKHFTSARPGPAADPANFDVPAVNHKLFVEDDMPGKSQTITRVGFRGPSLDNPDYYPVKIMSKVLGGGRGGVLYNKLKNNDFRAYEVDAKLNSYHNGGAISFYFISDSKSGSRAQASFHIKNELVLLLRENRIYRKALERAANIAKTEVDKMLADPLKEAHALSKRKLYGMDIYELYSMKSHFDNVDTIDILRVAAKYFKQNNKDYLDFYVESVITQSPEVQPSYEKTSEKVLAQPATAKDE